MSKLIAIIGQPSNGGGGGLFGGSFGQNYSTTTTPPPNSRQWRANNSDLSLATKLYFDYTNAVSYTHLTLPTICSV